MIFTDSLYLALSGETLDELVRPELKEEWEANKHKWFPRTDTPDNIDYDRRKPGIYFNHFIKVECGMVLKIESVIRSIAWLGNQ